MKPAPFFEAHKKSGRESYLENKEKVKNEAEECKEAIAAVARTKLLEDGLSEERIDHIIEEFKKDFPARAVTRYDEKVLPPHASPRLNCG